MEGVVKGLRAAFATGVTKSLQFRETQLKGLKNFLLENEAELSEALKQDLGKCPAESLVMELDLAVTEINDCLKNFKYWAKPQYVSKTLLYKSFSCYVQPEPYGVVLIIGAWNYPIQLTVLPLIGAIMAGNCAVLKPSEISPKTAECLEQLLPKYLDNACFKVINGGVPETTQLLAQKFDFIFYTGNSRVARVVSEAAAKNLTPVLLELGGKSPTYVDETANLDITANRIVWGKYTNCGQVCVAPDYILCSPKIKDELLQKLKATIISFYGENPLESADYGRIVNQNHFDRINSMLKEEGVEVYYGGKTDRDQKYISPTIVTNVSSDKKCMTDEIFGPILPVLTVESEEEALEKINSRDKPLSLYVFTSSRQTIDRFRNETSCGMFVANDCVLQGGLSTLPFGGVGESGMGKYHGKWSFDAFSHPKSCMEVPTKLVEPANHRMRYPPYTESKLGWMRWVMSGRGSACSIM